MPIMPTAVRQFIEEAIVPGSMPLPCHYPRQEDWEGWQIGFRRHGITGENLVGTSPGAWQPGWYVIALNGFDDPFFIDLDEEAQGFPVYYAPHGAGRWDAERIASSLRHFAEILATLRDIGADETAAQDYLEREVGLAGELWPDVLEHYRSAAQEEHEEAPLEAPPGDEVWQHGALIITRIGPQKMKVVQFLRQALDLSPQEALALAGRQNIPVAQGYLVRLQRTQAHLQGLGATVEFRPDSPGLRTFQRDTFLRIEELIDCVKAWQERELAYGLYTAEAGAFGPGDAVFIAGPVQVDANGEEAYPDSVTRRGLRLSYSGEQFQDVVDLSIQQKPDANHADIIRALNHYSELDDFLDIGE
jgi:hypothetical protein